MIPTFLLAFCATIVPASQAKVETLRGAHFEITAHFEARKLAEEALAAAESVVPHLEALFGPVAIERKGAVVTGPRMPIHVYWAKFDWTDGGPAPASCARELAFTSDATNQGYVVITPVSVMNALSAAGLPLRVKLDVARVAAQLWARRASPLAPRWPYWFLEGGTAYAAEEGCRARGWLPSRLEYPALATEILHVQALERAHGLPSVFAFVDGIPGGLTASERQAVADQLFRFLKEPANALLLDKVAYAARVTKQDDVAAAVARVMRSVVGDTQAEEQLDAAFVAWLRVLRPAWLEVHASLWPVGNTWMQAAGGSNAMTWRADVAPSARYELSGETAFFPAEHRQANVLLARTEHTFVQVAFVADHGVDVTQFDTRRADNERWKKLASAEVASLKEGRFIPFRLVADKTALEVWVEGTQLLSLTDVDVTLAGAWGLGTFAGSCCAWQSIAFKELP